MAAFAAAALPAAAPAAPAVPAAAARARPRIAGRFGGAALAGAAPGGAAAAAAAVAAASRRRRQAAPRRQRPRGREVHAQAAPQDGPRAATQQEWRERCSGVADGAVTFDVCVPKPLGVELRDFPNRPGVGIAAVKDEGGAMTVNQDVLTKDGEGMWILEGDEVLAVEGTPCEGDLDKVVELVMGSPGDKVTITLCRNYLRSPKGPIKVVFRPSGGMATVGRGNNFTDIASSVQEDVNYSCQEGWCGSCWHREVATGKVVRMCTDEVPGVWDNVMPMTLVAAPETNRKE